MNEMIIFFYPLTSLQSEELGRRTIWKLYIEVFNSVVISCHLDK